MVGKKDHTWILGDFAFCDHGKFLSRLNGKKYLVAGSHDDMPLVALRNFSNFAGSIDAMRTAMLKLGDRRYWLQHTCCRVWEASHYGVAHLFGHTHGRLVTFNLSFDVGIFSELAKFKPIHSSVVNAEIDRRTAVMENDGRIIYEEKHGKKVKLFRQDDVFYLNNKLTGGNSWDIVGRGALHE